MERAKYFIIILLSLFSSSIQASNKTEIYRAFVSSNMSEWKKVIDRMHVVEDKNNEHILELLNYQYGFIAWCLGNNNYHLAEEYLARGEKNIEILERRNYSVSLVNSYKSAFYGFRIGLNKLHAPWIGPRSIEHAEKAIQLDRKNPYAYIQYANIQFYMPRIFGGSKSVALENYSKAQKLMERHAEGTESDWNYLNLLTMIANVYQSLGQYDQAKACYENILKIEPEYLWARDELLPQLLKKIKQDTSV